MSEELKPGDRVKHASLGEGIAEKVSVNKGTAFVKFEGRAIGEYIALNMLTKVEPEPKETLDDKLFAWLHERVYKYNVGDVGRDVDRWAQEQVVDICREHFDSKREEIEALIENGSSVKADTDTLREILFGEES